MFQLRSDSPAATQAIAAALAAVVRPGDLIVLAGEMGAGKTAFAQGFGRALGVTQPITSPTFTLVHSYAVGKVQMHHVDLYRLASLHEVADLGIPELLETGGIVLVEWGDVVAGTLGEHLLVRLGRDDAADPAADPDAADDVRVIDVSATGPTWARRWAAVEHALERYRC